MDKPARQDPGEPPIRAHTYDGIAEYDNRLPNWWLLTLHLSIVFSVFYWLYHHRTGVGATDREVFEERMAAVREARLAGALGPLDDAELWSMSLDPRTVEAGRALYATNCAACHLASLRGKEENPAAIGPSLVDGEWIHGSAPADVRRIIAGGVLEKGMPGWAAVLGDGKVLEVTAFVLSHHPPPAGTPAP